MAPANMSVRKLGADTSVALVAHVNSLIVCSHRVGVNVKGTHKHLDKNGVGVKSK